MVAVALGCVGCMSNLVGGRYYVLSHSLSSAIVQLARMNRLPNKCCLPCMDLTATGEHSHGSPFSCLPLAYHMTLQYFTVSIVSEVLRASCAGIAHIANNDNGQPQRIMSISDEDVESVDLINL